MDVLQEVGWIGVETDVAHWAHIGGFLPGSRYCLSPASSNQFQSPTHWRILQNKTPIGKRARQRQISGVTVVDARTLSNHNAVQGQ